MHAYAHEHAQLIRGDILGMANDISNARPLYNQSRKTFLQLLTSDADARNLRGAMLIDKEGHMLVYGANRNELGLTHQTPDFLRRLLEAKKIRRSR